MKLVDDWRDWWRWNSTYVVGIIVAAPSAWENVSPEMKAHVPDGALPYIAAGMFIAFLVARVRQQP